MQKYQKDVTNQGPSHKRIPFESFEDTPLPVAVLTYLGYGVLIIFGHLCDFLRKWELLYHPVAPDLNEVCKKIRIFGYIILYDF